MRRIEAITGEEVLRYIAEQEEKVEKAAGRLKTIPDNLLERIEALRAREKELEKELKELKGRLARTALDELLEKVEEVDGVKLLRTEVEGLDNEVYLNLTDQVEGKIYSGIIVWLQGAMIRRFFVARVSKDLVEKGYHAEAYRPGSQNCRWRRWRQAGYGPGRRQGC